MTLFAGIGDEIIYSGIVAIVVIVASVLYNLRSSHPPPSHSPQPSSNEEVKERSPEPRVSSEEGSSRDESPPIDEISVEQSSSEKTLNRESSEESSEENLEEKLSEPPNSTDRNSNEIRVKILHGENSDELCVPKNMTILSLKQRVFESELAAVGTSVTFIWKGKRMEDHHTLSYYPYEVDGVMFIHASVQVPSPDQMDHMAGRQAEQATDELHNKIARLVVVGFFGGVLALFWWLSVTYSQYVDGLSFAILVILSALYVLVTHKVFLRTFSSIVANRRPEQHLHAS